MALRDQETVLLDEDLAWQYQHLLDRVWAEGPPVLLCVAANPGFDPTQVFVDNPPKDVADAWSAGSVSTGYPRLDRVLYENKIASVEKPSYSSTFRLQSDAFLNTVRLADLLMETVQDMRVEVSTTSLGGEDIELAREADGWTLRFIEGWGDCLVGCIERHYWEYHVPDDPEAAVTLLDEGGDPFPDGYEEICYRPADYDNQAGTD